MCDWKKNTSKWKTKTDDKFLHREKEREREKPKLGNPNKKNKRRYSFK